MPEEQQTQTPDPDQPVTLGALTALLGDFKTGLLTDVNKATHAAITKRVKATPVVTPPKGDDEETEGEATPPVVGKPPADDSTAKALAKMQREMKELRAGKAESDQKAFAALVASDFDTFAKDKLASGFETMIRAEFLKTGKLDAKTQTASFEMDGLPVTMGEAFDSWLGDDSRKHFRVAPKVPTQIQGHRPPSVVGTLPQNQSREARFSAALNASAER